MDVNNLLRYTNGTGHLIMSIVCLLVGLCLVLFAPDPGTKATGTTIILTVFGAWFIPGAARQVAHEVSKQVQTTSSTPATSAVPETHSLDETQKLPVVKK